MRWCGFRGSSTPQYIQILFGVIHGEGGIGIVNGHIIVIPPRGPAYRLFAQIADGITEVARGFEVRQAVEELRSSLLHG